MAEYYYPDALRLGKKEAHRCEAAGEPPYLALLEDIVPSGSLTGGVDLGIVQIPSHFIIGTKSAGRAESFAANYMPVIEEGTEFSNKWERLCRAHLSEGIREPIKAWEYMNRFYVEEGHKRVSVLRYFDSPKVQGHVIRILPPRTGEETVERYYEFTSFYKDSGINDLEFSKRGSYAVLQQALGKQRDEKWTEDERRRFSAAYYYFGVAYQACGGAKLPSTVGDALLRYIQIYGFAELCNASARELKGNLTRIWEEIKLQQEETPIEVKLSPAEENRKGLLTRILPSSSASTLRAAFVHDGTPERSGWVQGHELGRQHVQRVFGGRIQTRAYENAMAEDPMQVLEQAVKDGSQVIFTTSPRLLNASLRKAVEHPEVVFMNCSLNTSHRYIRSYYARTYEAKFIIGAIAGSLTESGHIGYICDYPIYGMISGINAFALGAQMTNPGVKVHLEWSSVKGAEAAERSLVRQGIHLISTQDSARLNKGYQSSFGLFCIHEGERELLATPVWKWGVYYEEILRRMLNRTAKTEYESSRKALNYYWGISAGVVDISYGETLQAGTLRLAEILKDSLFRNSAVPFLTPLRLQNGDLVGVGQHELSLEQIISMDYLVENVVGEIPPYEQLTPLGQATVDSSGVLGSTKMST